MERLVGAKAPNFSMQAVTGDGEDFITVNLNDYQGKWLVLLFYPQDFTFVCPTELTSFSKEIEHFKNLKAELLSVSTDSIYCHQAWIENALGKINYPMASDKTMTVSKEYGVLIEENGVTLRGLFLIDPDQIIRYSVVQDLNVGRSTAEILRVLAAFQTGALCPGNWSKGDKTL